MPEKLLVELDGGQHAEERAAHDQRRDAFLRSKGYRVLRFWNNDVFDNCFGVLERVYETLVNPPPLTSNPFPPSPFGPTPSPMSSAPSPLEGEGWGGGSPGGGPPGGQSPPPAPTESPTPTTDWTPERARAYLDAMDPQIVDLFPDRLAPSELGEIPEGWE